MTLLKRILNSLYPVLSPVAAWYLSKPRTFNYQGIKIHVLPGVFHPGLFLSTRILLRYLQHQKLEHKKILELGAGSGLISIFCARQGADVTASDISKIALDGIRDNAESNSIKLNICESDLFDRINIPAFDLIIINPPYYPKPILSEKDLPWFCGEGYEYFEKLFFQLKGRTFGEILMILSEDCNFNQIEFIAKKNLLRLTKVYSVKKWGEWNFIYQISL